MEIEKGVEYARGRRAQYHEMENQVESSKDCQVFKIDPDARAVIKHRNIVEMGYNIQKIVDVGQNMIVDVYANGITDRGDLEVAA